MWAAHQLPPHPATTCDDETHQKAADGVAVDAQIVYMYLSVTGGTSRDSPIICDMWLSYVDLFNGRWNPPWLSLVDDYYLIQCWYDEVMGDGLIGVESNNGLAYVWCY